VPLPAAYVMEVFEVDVAVAWSQMVVDVSSMLM